MIIEYWNGSKPHRRRKIADNLMGSLIFGFIIAAYDHHTIIDLGIQHESATN